MAESMVEVDTLIFDIDDTLYDSVQSRGYSERAQPVIDESIPLVQSVCCCE